MNDGTHGDEAPWWEARPYRATAKWSGLPSRIRTREPATALSLRIFWMPRVFGQEQPGVHQHADFPLVGREQMSPHVPGHLGAAISSRPSASGQM